VCVCVCVCACVHSTQEEQRHCRDRDRHVVCINEVKRFRNQITLVLEYFEHEHFRFYFKKMELVHVQRYMKALLTALSHLHRDKVIHRDIKPSNFLHSFKNPDQFCLVDFGLAQDQPEEATFTDDESEEEPYKPNPKRTQREQTESPPKTLFPNSADPSHSRDSLLKRSNRMVAAANSSIVTSSGSASKKRSSSRHPSKPPKEKLPSVGRAGTRGFRAPEVLLKVPLQTVAIDVWSAGIIFLCILSRRYPFFNAPDDPTALGEVIEFFGTPSKKQSLERIAFMTDASQERLHTKGVDIPKFCRESSSKNWPAAAYDLLLRCLDLSPRTRISAEEALKHEFFTLDPSEHLI